jgi:uncharacterized YccA/Bax inhibitor family protein
MIEGTWNESARAGARRMKAHLVVIIVTALAAVTCGATFLLALFGQFALVEVAATLAAGAEVFFLSSSIGDLLEERGQPNRTRFLAALGLAVAIVMYFLIMRFKESARG